jgi:hypothetical protein
MKPAVADSRFCEFRVFVIFLHDPVAPDDDLAHFASDHLFSILSNDPRVPEEVRLPDGADLSLVFTAQMNDSGT